MAEYNPHSEMEDLLEHLENDAEDGPFAHDPSVEPTLTPIWREAIWPGEFARLHCHPIFWGRGVEHGDGRYVLVIPGFIANDLIMLPMRQWMRRIGYKPRKAHIHWNTNCPDKTANSLVRQVKLLHKKSGRKVILVGHSLGGMLAKTVVQKIPELVDRVVTLGSPFRDLVEAHPAVTGVWDYLKVGQGKLIGRHLKASCGTGYCVCSFVGSMISPAECDVPQFAIYSRNDGVVGWESCAEKNPDNNIEVNQASHMGLAFNVEAYKALAKRMAQQV